MFSRVLKQTPLDQGTGYELFIINWHPVAEGTSELDIYFDVLAAENSNPIGVSEVKSAGTIHVTEPDTMP